MTAPTTTPVHPIQIGGDARRLYILGAAARVLGIAALLLILWAVIGLDNSTTVTIASGAVAAVVVALGRHLMTAAMWRVPTKAQPLLPHWPLLIERAVTLTATVAIVVITSAVGEGWVPLLWTGLAAGLATAAVLGWISFTVGNKFPDRRWLFPQTIHSATALTVDSVVVAVAVWLMYDANSVTTWAISSAEQSGWSQERIDAIPTENYATFAVSFGAFSAAFAAGMAFALRMSRGPRAHSTPRLTL